MMRTMKREPYHYPEWLREILYDPLQRSNYRSGICCNPERNWNTLKEIFDRTYRIDPKDALIFDMTIEMERSTIQYQETIHSLGKLVMELTQRVHTLERKTEGI